MHQNIGTAQFVALHLTQVGIELQREHNSKQ